MRRWKAAAAAALAATLFVCTACTPPADTDTAIVASVDEPQPLSDAQADLLAGMQFRNHTAGVVAFEGQLFGAENGDMALAGWIDFAAKSGYAVVTPPGAPAILVLWTEREVAFLDIDQSPTMPPVTVPVGPWQVAELVPDTSELTRMLAALLLLSADRPDNPQLIRQNGARFLGTESIDGVTVERFSGVAPGGAGGAADLGTQYWIDGDGALVRFGLRLAGTSLSTLDFTSNVAEAPIPLPVPSDVGVAGVG